MDIWDRNSKVCTKDMGIQQKLFKSVERNKHSNITFRFPKIYEQGATSPDTLKTICENNISLTMNSQYEQTQKLLISLFDLCLTKAIKRRRVKISRSIMNVESWQLSFTFLCIQFIILKRIICAQMSMHCIQLESPYHSGTSTYIKRPDCGFCFVSKNIWISLGPSFVK